MGMGIVTELGMGMGMGGNGNVKSHSRTPLLSPTHELRPSAAHPEHATFADSSAAAVHHD